MRTGIGEGHVDTTDRSVSQDIKSLNSENHPISRLSGCASQVSINATASSKSKSVSRAHVVAYRVSKRGTGATNRICLGKVVDKCDC